MSQIVSYEPTPARVFGGLTSKMAAISDCNRGKSGQTGNDRVLAEEPLFGQEMCLNKDRPVRQRAESPEPKSRRQVLSADWRGGKR